MKDTRILYCKYPTDGRAKVYFEAVNTILWDIQRQRPLAEKVDNETVLSFHKVSEDIEDIIRFLESQSLVNFSRERYESLIKVMDDKNLLSVNDALLGIIDLSGSKPYYNKGAGGQTALWLRNELMALRETQHPLFDRLVQMLACISGFEGKVNGTDSANATWHHSSCYDVECECHFCLQSRSLKGLGSKNRDLFFFYVLCSYLLHFSFRYVNIP